MSDGERRSEACCFTGHRPDKLFRAEDIRLDLKEVVLNAVDTGFTTFISGMAKGVDVWAAEIVLEIRKDNDNIKLICALPSQEWLQRCKCLCDKADAVVIIGKGHHPGIYQLRNQWMIDHSSRVIAVYNGQLGGTKTLLIMQTELACLFIGLEGKSM